MNKSKLFLSSAALFCAGITSSFATESAPLLSVELESYAALLSDVGAIAAAVGEDTSMLEMQLGGMLGPGVMDLIDQSQPWHAAVWMEAFGQPPVIAVVLPVADSEALKAAMETSMLAMMGAQVLDAGDRVVLFGSNPGVPIADNWVERIQGYAEALVLAPTETLQIRVELSEQIREAAVAAIAIPKAQMMAVMNDPSMTANSGMPEGTVAGIMEGYFSMYETLLRDLDHLEYGMSVEADDWTFELSLTPLPDSKSAKFLASQNIDITDLGSSALWDSDFAMVIGMAALPEDWQPTLSELMKGLMPLYGLSEDVAADWMEGMNMTLPFKGVYNMNLDGGMTYSGFYEILETPATEVYDKWLKISEGAVAGTGSTPPYYSDITIEKGYRTQSDHPVDLMVLTMNPEHPMMAIPEQKALMDQMFKDGKITYEMCLIDNRIYMGTEGVLNDVMAQTRSKPPIEINANTRIAGSMNIISLMKVGNELAGSEAMLDLSSVDSKGAAQSFSVETSDALKIKAVTPLKLLKAFSGVE